MSKRGLGLCVALLAAGSASARDGVIEINQRVAEAGSINGSPAQDPPGFPVHITASGSYVLTSDLVVGNATTNAIEVGGGAAVALAVSIDLGGFAIRGPVTCTGEGLTLVCSPSGGTGFAIIASFADSISVRNGRFLGLPFGLYAGARTCIARDLISMNTGTTYLGGACLLLGSTFSFGPGNGVAVTGSTASAIVADDLASANLYSGFSGGNALLLRDAMRENGQVGFSNAAATYGPSLISNTSVSWNALGGVACPGEPCLLIDDSLSQNTSYQLDVTGCSAGYTNTVVWANFLGTTVLGGCSASALAPNLCNGSLTCP